MPLLTPGAGWRRLPCLMCLALLLVDFPITPISGEEAAPLVLGPSQFLDPGTLLDPSDLEIEILSDTVRPSSLRAGRSVRDLKVGFKSQSWKGAEWRHRARIFLPADHPGGGGAGIIGVHRDTFDSPESGRREDRFQPLCRVRRGHRPRPRDPQVRLF